MQTRAGCQVGVESSFDHQHPESPGLGQDQIKCCVQHRSNELKYSQIHTYQNTFKHANKRQQRENTLFPTAGLLIANQVKQQATPQYKTILKWAGHPNLKNLCQYDKSPLQICFAKQSQVHTFRRFYGIYLLRAFISYVMLETNLICLIV